MSEKLISVSVISPEKVLYSGTASSVTLPGNLGSFTVLADHVNMVSLMEPGILTVKSGANEVNLIIDGGFVEISHNNVNALVEGIVDISDVDVDTEKKAIESLLAEIIPQEKRSKTENKLAGHRLRISLAQKK